MSEQEWTLYMALLEQAQGQQAPHCVSCWYEEHQEAFPAQDSSSLCTEHAETVRTTYYEHRKAGSICTS